MINNWVKSIRYIVASEESRPGREDYWNNVFLADKAPLNRAWLETSKILFVIALSICLSMIMALL